MVVLLIELLTKQIKKGVDMKITVELTSEEIKEIRLALARQVDRLLEKYDETGDERYNQRADKVDAIWYKMRENERKGAQLNERHLI